MDIIEVESGIQHVRAVLLFFIDFLYNMIK